MVNSKIRSWEGRMSQLAKPSDMRGWYAAEALVTLSARPGENNKRKKDSLRVSFNQRILQMTGWTMETQLDVEFHDNQGTVFEVSEGGKPLRMVSKSAKRPTLLYALKQGTMKGFPSGVARNVEVERGVVAFDLPA